MDYGLKNKKVTVTAGSSGIGLSIAESFVKEGSVVTVCSREPEKVKNNNIKGLICNLKDEKSVRSFADEVINSGGADILVLNSGGPESGNFSDVNLNNWDDAYNMLIRSNIILLEKFIPKMIENKWGRVVFMTSISVAKPLNNLIISNSLRRAVEGLSKSMAVEYSKYNITFNCVGPGYTLTERLTALSDKIATEENITPEDVYKIWKENTAAQSLAMPEDIASIVLFLASVGAKYVTGESIIADGGFILK